MHRPANVSTRHLLCFRTHARSQMHTHSQMHRQSLMHRQDTQKTTPTHHTRSKTNGTMAREMRTTGDNMVARTRYQVCTAAVVLSPRQCVAVATLELCLPFRSIQGGTCQKGYGGGADHRRYRAHRDAACASRYAHGPPRRAPASCDSSRNETAVIP